MDKINGLDAANIRTMEEALYLNGTIPYSTLSVSDMKTKILEFSNYLTDTRKHSLSNCGQEQYEEILSLLFSLKKGVKDTINELMGSHSQRNCAEYICCECNEPIYTNPYQNFWNSLQNHEHVEYLFSKFLNGEMNNAVDDVIEEQPDETFVNAVTNTSNFECTNENTDSGIDNEICETDFNEKYEANENEVNSFRFNFVVRYNDAIENKVYPDRLMKAIRKIDRVREYTVQKTGPYRAVCLLCNCDLIAKNKNKVSNFIIEDHCLGQRHLRHASTPENVEVVKKYHELFLNLEASYQAHQVFFKPKMTCLILQCFLCFVSLPHTDLLAHINRESHKEKVFDLYKKKINTFFLTELQIQAYGVILAPIENEIVKKEKVPVKTKISNEKTNSDSNSSSDVKDAKHNIIKSVENSTSQNFLDLIPNRFRDHLKCLKINADVISCVACKIVLPKNVNMIKKHLSKSTHTKASNIRQRKYNYHCEICNVKIPDEATWDSHFTDGPNKHANMAESRKSKTTEYECTKCCTVIYGDDLSLTRHLSMNLRKDKKSKELKLPEPVNKLFRSKAVIKTEADKLTFEANDTLKYSQLTTECCNRLEATLNSTFQGCTAFPFGSRISGLGDQYSDLDVFIDIGGMYTGYKNQDSLSQVQIVRKAAAALGRHKEEFQDVFQIPTARTPIVKLFHSMTEIECDLSFRHALSVENTKFLRFCLNLQPIAQPFILILKKWSQHNNFTEHISTYALALMAIFFLQIKGHLLSVTKLRELNPQKSLVIYGWETINYTMPLEQMKAFVQPYTNSISDLLKDFFNYYAKFKYPEDVVCPLLGRTILKKQFHDKNLPSEMKAYVAQLQNEEHEEFRALSPMCIQDPFDLSHNLTKACQPGTVNKFKAMCELSFKRLDSFE